MKNLSSSFMIMLTLLQSSHFLNKLHPIALPFRDGIRWWWKLVNKKTVLRLKFHHHRDDMIYFIKTHTTNHFHYYHLLPTTKWGIIVQDLSKFIHPCNACIYRNMVKKWLFFIQIFSTEVDHLYAYRIYIGTQKICNLDDGFPWEVG